MALILTIIYGLVSTVLSSLSNRWVSELSNPLPGLLFGAFILIVSGQIFGQVHAIWKKILFVIVSGAAYMAAMVFAYTSIYSISGNCTSWGPCENQYLFAYFVGALAGGIILSFGIKLILRAINWFQVWFLIFLSCILGPLGYIVDNAIKNNQQSMSFWQFWLNIWQYHQNFGLYLVWQTGMLLAFGIFMLLNQKKMSKFRQSPITNINL